ncbi:MAG: division/cell wall cluster transcriptional repressor MraZ [Rhodothalassiaceae bacterium]
MRFTANYVNKVDKKGRVSVPARFRALLAESSFPGICVYESFRLPCLEGSSREFMDRLSERLDEDFAAFEDAKDALAATILGGAFDLPFDNEGRVLLPQSLLRFANIGDQAVFVGVGEKFYIWEPDAWEAYRAEMREKAREAAAKLGALRRPGEVRGG